MEADLINQGVTLMLVGMGTVFVFLTALVGAMTAMSHAARKFTPEPLVAGIGDEEIGDEEIAAIGAAIRQHRGH